MAIKRETEASFQRAVIAFARLHGWADHHEYDSRRSTAGVPDLMLLRAGRLVFAELKVGKNKPTTEQRWWLAALAVVAGVEAHVWYPADWAEIEDVLGRG